MNRIEKILKNEYENYLYPFFWQHGEDTKILVKYMEEIYNCGMRAVCVEARPHPDFIGIKWWEDLDTIIAKSKQLGMKLWILDDSHFPTGYANGRIKAEFPQYKKLYLDVRRFDVHGPMDGARINAKRLKGRIWEKPDAKEQNIIGIYLAKRLKENNEANDAIDPSTITDITKNINEGIITLDIPKGAYSIFVVFYGHNGGEEATKDYLNPLVKEATRVLIDEVYEPHYEHYKDDFGDTILGFFSDEPRFGNKKGVDSQIGRTDMVLPWREGLETELSFSMKYLPLLWYEADGAERKIRYEYMNIITRLYSENFTDVLSSWCNDRGINYLGHNIEDNGAHSRLGYGTGHYFRGQSSQDFSGIDVIGTQIVPGMTYHHDSFSTGGCDGEFYHYALAKLGASLAHLDPKKQGRAMCEAFGAYGWNEGLKLMKWITDHLLVRGINYIVPHAFNPKEYPDWDCPPHFYAHGNNPQFRYFKLYTAYANRIMTLLNGGIHRAPCAVMYTAECEWSGKCMPIERVLRVLTQNQIDSDIVPADYFKRAMIENGRLKVEKEYFEALIISKTEAIPMEIAKQLIGFAKEGLRVIFVDELPSYALGDRNGITIAKLDKHCEVCSLDELADNLSMIKEVRTDKYFKDLVYYHYEHKDFDVYMFFNESVYENINTRLELLNDKGYAYSYDAFENKLYELDNATGLILNLTPYQSEILILSSEKIEALKKKTDINSLSRQKISSRWTVKYADSLSYPDFGEELSVNELILLNTLTGFEDRAGTVSYNTELTLKNNGYGIFIELENVYETAEVFINGRSVGIKICAPYVFDITESAIDGLNKIKIEVTNTLGAGNQDALSQYLVIEPFGAERAYILS